MENKLNALKNMLSPDYDWDKYWEGIEAGTTEDICLDDLFRECFSVFTVLGSDKKGFSCTGFDVKDTPKALYRALYLGLPDKVDFSDMYKSGTLFGFESKCENFFSAIVLYKYEINVYNYCKNREDIGGQPHCIQGGWASCDNGIYCISNVGKLWFEVLKIALETEWEIYSGNHFEV